MPIKYQALGGSGGTDLILKVAPNVSVTLSKGNYTNTITTNENGQALFKNLSNGTYIATAQDSDGTQYQKEILINDIKEDVLIVQKIANLPVGSKIELSSGRKFILMKHKAEAHDQNGATFVSEFIQEDFEWVFNSYGGPLYDVYSGVQTLLAKYLDELSGYERKNVLNFSADGLKRNTSGKWENPKIDQRFYLLSMAEVGYDSSDFNEKASERNLGFPDTDSRIKRYENGEAGTYWLRNGYHKTPNSNHWCIGSNGMQNQIIGDSSKPFTAGIVLGVDISENAMVYLESDGYYRVTDK